MNNRNNNLALQTPFGPVGFPTNMMMFPNYMNDNYNALEKRIKVLETKVSRLETLCQNQQNYQGNTNSQQNDNIPYQTTQNNSLYNGEMYMM